MSPPPPFGLCSLSANTSCHLKLRTASTMHRSHTLATTPSYSGSLFDFLPIDTSTIYDRPRRLHLRRTVHDGFESSPIRRRHGAFGNLLPTIPESKNVLDTPLRSRILAARMRKYRPPRQPGKILTKRRNAPGPYEHRPTPPRRSKPPCKIVGNQFERLRLPRLLSQYLSWI